MTFFACRLIVPSKKEAPPSSSDQQPLVMIETDERYDLTTADILAFLHELQF